MRYLAWDCLRVSRCWPGTTLVVTEPTRALSALNLRAVLAAFGLVVCGVGGAVVLAAGKTAFGVVLLVLAAGAVLDLVVVLVRRRREPGQHQTLFE